MSLNDTVYFKIKFTDLTQEWLDRSLITNINTLRFTNHSLLADKYVMIKFKKEHIPVTLYQIELGNEMTQVEALAEIEGSTWE